MVFWPLSSPRDSDALVPRRGGESSSQASERVVNQMLTEMDGLDGNKQLFVVAATNRPDMIDPAMLRPGAPPRRRERKGVSSLG